MTGRSIFFRRCQKVVPEKLSLTGNLACDGQLTRRLFDSILRQVENGFITNMPARVSARGAQNSLYQAHIVAQLNPHPFAQQNRRNRAGVSPYPACVRLLRFGVNARVRAAFNFAHIGGQIPGTHAVGAQNIELRVRPGQLRRGEGFDVKNSPKSGGIWGTMPRCPRARVGARGMRIQRNDRTAGGRIEGNNENVHTPIIGERTPNMRRRLCVNLHVGANSMMAIYVQTLPRQIF